MPESRGVKETIDLATAVCDVVEEYLRERGALPFTATERERPTLRLIRGGDDA